MSAKEFKELSKARNFLRAVVLAAGGFYFGYYIACMNALSKPILEGVLGYDPVADLDLLNTLNGLVNLLFGVGAFIGVVTAGELAKWFGRIPLLYSGEVIALLNLVPSLIKGIVPFLISRTISGLVAGINVSIYSIILAELLPNKLCGIGGSLANIFICVGMMLSYLCQNIWSYQDLVDYWRLFLAYPLVVSLVRLVLFVFLFRTETPKCIFERAISKSQPKKTKQNIVIPSPESEATIQDGAETSRPLPGAPIEQPLETTNSKASMNLASFSQLKHAYSYIYHPDDLETVVKEYSDFWTEEEANGRGTVTFRHLFGANYRRQLVSGCFVSFAFQLSGINFMFYYSTVIFDALIADSGKLITLLVGISNIVGGCVSPFLISRLGRKINLLIGTALQALGMVLLSVGYSVVNLPLISVATVVYVAGFSFGFGATQTAYVSEILPPSGVGVAFGVQWAFDCFISIIVPFMVIWVGALAMMVFFLAFNVLAVLYMWMTCVETKNKLPDVIYKEFNKAWFHWCSK